ncbi:MAG TPA: hypothetical protein VGN72_09650 [Tepidisphaeraceae bacterium]|jgi:hypothetical protein|nr:hypothetical protein [Tepidisphaeraceae bacterium]
MALTSEQIQRLFKVMGKVIFLHQRAPGDATAYRKLMSATIDQSVSGAASDANTITRFLNPFTTQINATISALDATPAQARTMGATFLQQCIAPDMGFGAGSQLSQIDTRLMADMTAADESVAPSGDNMANDDCFAAFFATQYGIVLRQDADPSIPDAYIDDDVV